MSIAAWRKLSTRTRQSSGRLAAIALLLTVGSLMLACGGNGASIKPTPLPVNVQITPGASTVVMGLSQTFTATVHNTLNAGISWSVQEGAAGGVVSAKGVYTAPMRPGSYHVTAASLADPAMTAIAAVTVTAPVPAITSTPPTAANEGDVYTYTLAASDPYASSITTFSVASGPDGAQINGNILTWTPTHAQSRVPNAFSIQATTGWNGSANQRFSVTPLGTIRGTAIDSYVTAKGSVTGAEDLTKVYIGASIPKGTGWLTIQGIAHSDGTFEIHGVPAGSYWFAAASGGYWTSNSDIDLGQDFLGRPDRLVPTTPTYLALKFLGLESWDSDDSLEVVDPNLGQSFDMSDSINPGEGSATATWAWTGPLSDASRGDAWSVSQVSSKTLGNSSWRYMARATPAISTTQTDGSTTSVSGTLVPAAPLTVHLKALGSQFAALAPAVGLNAEVDSTLIGVYSQPFSSLKGSIGGAHTLVERIDQDPILTDTDVDVDVSFGNPFPSDWTPFVTLEYELMVPFTASGATSEVDVPAEIFITTTELPSISKPLAPVITPVLNVKLNGSALTQPRTTATLSPSLTWDPPTTGIATGYRVTIYQLLKKGSSSGYQPLLDLFTRDAKMAIPDGVLLAGNEYFFAVRSYLTPGVDFTQAPYRAGFPWAHTDMLTAVFSTVGATSPAPALQSAMQRIGRSEMDQAGPRAGSIKTQGLRSTPHAKVAQ